MMNVKELKQLAHRGHPEVHILSNEGDLYLIQIFSEGRQAMLTHNRSTRPMVFHGLPECYEKLSDAGVHRAYVDQTLAYDEMIASSADPVSHTDHRAVSF